MYMLYTVLDSIATYIESLSSRSPALELHTRYRNENTHNDKNVELSGRHNSVYTNYCMIIVFDDYNYYIEKTVYLKLYKPPL